MARTHPNTAARDAMTAAGLRHADVATHLGIDASKLSKSLSGVRRFGADELERLAEITGVAVDSLRPLSTPATGHAPSAARPREAEWAARRRAIASAAWPLFTSHGYQAVKVADIAREPGVSSSAVHYYFNSKHAIFLATLDLCSEQAAERREAVASISDPAQRLVRFALAPDYPDAASTGYGVWYGTATEADRLHVGTRPSGLELMDRGHQVLLGFPLDDPFTEPGAIGWGLGWTWYGPVDGLFPGPRVPYGCSDRDSLTPESVDDALR